MAEKLRAIRWLGTSGVGIDKHGSAFRAGQPSGVLRLGTRNVHPGEIVDKQEDLALLGAARIKELIFMQQAQDVASSPRPKDDISDGTSPRERALAAEAVAAGIQYSQISAALWKHDLEAGFVTADGKLTKAGEARVHLAQGGFQE
jgi:hypothetical protein